MNVTRIRLADRPGQDADPSRPRRRFGAQARPMRADVAVIGSGPGGAVTAALLAEAGRDVLLIEEGPFVALEECVPFSMGEMLAKYRNGGVTVAMGSTKVAYVEGRCVGGGSEINSGLYHRTPPEVLDVWRKDFGVEHLNDADLLPHFEASERDVGVSYLPGPAPAASLKLHEGATRLGWKSLEVPRWFRYDPPADPSSRPKGTRQSMTKTFIPRALRSGCRLLPNTRAHKIHRIGNRWYIQGTSHPVNAPRESIEITADALFVCGGADPDPGPPASERDHPQRRELAPDAPDRQGDRALPRRGEQPRHGSARPPGQGVRAAVQLRLLDQRPAPPGARDERPPRPPRRGRSVREEHGRVLRDDHGSGERLGARGARVRRLPRPVPDHAVRPGRPCDGLA